MSAPLTAPVGLEELDAAWAAAGQAFGVGGGASPGNGATKFALPPDFPPEDGACLEWSDAGPGRLDVDRARAEIVSGAVLHNNLLRLAAHYARQGVGHIEIVHMLSALMHQSQVKDTERWKARLDALPENAASAVKKFGGTYSMKEDFTDLGNVNLLARLMDGNMRYVIERKTWILWTEGRWESDTSGKCTLSAAGRVAEHYAQEAAKLLAQLPGMDEDAAKRHRKTVDVVKAWEKTCRGRKGIENMLALASKHPAFVINAHDLDTHPHLLGVQNGVVNLRTGMLRPDARDDLITRRCACRFRPDAQAKRWREFIAEVTGFPIKAELDPNTGEVIASTVGRFRERPLYAGFLQRAMGYSTSAHTVEHKLFAVFNDNGSNGKNLVFDTAQKVLGDYARPASPKLLLKDRGNTGADAATPALAALDGARFVVCSEPPKGSSFDNAALKALTGERELPVRDNYRDSRRMRVGFHIWMICNSKPQVEHLEPAVVSRILMLPFDRQWNRPGVAAPDPTLPDGDKHLANALEVELEGILAWLVEGAVAYYGEGLVPCEEVVQATRAYFEQQDPVGKWLSQQQRCAARSGAQATELFKAFESWRVAGESAGDLASGDAPVTQTAFGLALGRHKVERAKHGVMRYGIRLPGNATPEEFVGGTEDSASGED